MRLKAVAGAAALAISITVSAGAASTGAARQRCARATLSSWRPSSGRFTPLSNVAAASCVRRVREIHPENVRFNHYVPSRAELQRWLQTPDHWGRLPAQADPYYRYVNGGFRGTTDEIIQWAAAKWGIPVNWLRAQFAQESVWYQQGVGDDEYVGPAWYELYPPQARIPGTYKVYETMGISQIKWTPDGTAGAGTEPLRWKSTAFAADYEAATVRFFFDDPGQAHSTSADPTYHPGQAWNSVAAWYDPYPWGNATQLWYVGIIQSQLRKHSWTKPFFCTTRANCATAGHL